MTAPVLITRDETLLHELLRLAAAAGVTPDVAEDPATALRAWSRASLVLLGSDLAAEVAATAPARRGGVHLVAWGAAGGELYPVAVAVGAESVLELPAAASWIADLVADVDDPRTPDAVTLGVVGGAGGAGATVLACALGQVAAHRGPTLVVDLDPLGPGVDRVLGLEERVGVGWEALEATVGRLGSTALRQALPVRDDLGVLTWRSGPGGPVPPPAARQALSAARRGHRTVVLDLPRTVDDAVGEVAARCDQVLVVVPATVSGAASAARVCARLADLCTPRLVVRGGGLDAEDVARAVGAPVLARMSDQRGLAESVDLGLGPVRSRRGPLARTAGLVLDRAHATPPRELAA